MLEAGAQHA